GAEVLVTVAGWPHQQMFMDAYRFRATTDRAGEFAFRGLDRAPLSLVAYSREATSDLVDVDLKSVAERTGIVVQLQHDGRIRGRVVATAERPVPFAQVTWFVETHSAPAGIDRAMASPRAQGVVVADENGRFVASGLVDADYQVTAQR